jgi:hypothetical protein
MADRKQAGFTPPTHPYPPYLNLTLEDDQLTVTVRAPANADGSMGAASAMTLPVADFRAMVRGLDGLL